MALTDLANPWVLVIAALATAVAVAAGWLLARRPRRGAGEAAPIARAEHVRALPSVARAARRRVVAIAASVALLVAAALVAGVVAARPMAAQTIRPVDTSRDIMLCLDVSGSMSEVDIEVLEVFDELLDGFEGERIGLTIFNSSPVQVFPLTDDYEFVRTHLASIRDAFDDYSSDVPEHWVGTLNGTGSSLVGDGLTACALRFDHLDSERSRSIVLATDNEVNGSGIVSLEEAATYARDAGVRVFALNPVDGKDGGVTAELTAAAETTGGRAYALRGDTTVADIVDDVREQEATALEGEARIVWRDSPDLWIVVLLVLASSGIVLLWRVRP
ncbi:VWA domain-containing protein [Microbacterium marinilacus]|uniref:VWA domain-containing protein n=1 Tax=Microbacterium marinilacus TaxID=415209 RepID=UPI001C8D8F0B|nr:VWA domain-containing protein [Microbacterium marinilacus]MBY0688248.1 VWA domain-containing protein [Microbacterium marinilacus]